MQGTQEEITRRLIDLQIKSNVKRKPSRERRRSNLDVELEGSWSGRSSRMEGEERKTSRLDEWRGVMMDEERWASSKVEQGREKSGETRRRRRCGMGGKDMGIAPVLDNLPGRVGDHKISVIVDDDHDAELRKKRISSGKYDNLPKNSKTK